MLEIYLIDHKKQTFKKNTINFSNEFERNNMFKEEIKSFYNCIKKKTIPDITLEDGINNLKLLIAAHKSIDTKKVVNVA